MLEIDHSTKKTGEHVWTYTIRYQHHWLVVSTPLKSMKVSWDYYSQYMEKMFQTTNQIIYQHNHFAAISTVYRSQIALVKNLWVAVFSAALPWSINHHSVDVFSMFGTSTPQFFPQKAFPSWARANIPRFPIPGNTGGFMGIPLIMALSSDWFKELVTGNLYI